MNKRTIQIVFLGAVSAVVALLGLSVALADIKNESANVPLVFPLEGDGLPGMPDMSFDTMGGAGGDESQTTCATTPGGTSPNLLLEEPLVPTSNAVDMPSESVASASFQQPSSQTPPTQPPPTRPYYPPPTPPQDPPSLPVPEPATLLVVGLGIGAALTARRLRGRKGQ